MLQSSCPNFKLRLSEITVLLFVIDWFYLKSKDVVRCKVIFLSQQFYNKLCLKDNICHNIMVSYNVCWSCHHNITIKRLCDDTIDPTTSHEEYERLKKQTSYRYLRELSQPIYYCNRWRGSRLSWNHSKWIGYTLLHKGMSLRFMHDAIFCFWRIPEAK